MSQHKMDLRTNICGRCLGTDADLPCISDEEMFAKQQLLLERAVEKYGMEDNWVLVTE
jgi:hypothetical protein